MRNILHTCFVAGTTCFVLLMATSAPAAAPQPTVSQKVYYGDLRLSTQEGERELRRRIFKAAGKLCRSIHQEMRERMRCRYNAVATAQPRMESVVLAARQEQLAAKG